MSNFLKEVDPGAASVLIEGYRRMDDVSRYQAIWNQIGYLRDLQMAEVRSRYPLATDHEVKMRVASRWIAPELMMRAFGWDVTREGY